MVIIETAVFTGQVLDLMSDDEYAKMQTGLARRPHAGLVIPGTGGLRKLRWSGSGRGKRGGTRIIYYWAVSKDQILMLFMYRKTERDDLKTDQLRTLKTIVEEEFH
jgi:mRNA-degrading endonuclease RelE of RelBE toxin-antitoxin system